MSKKIKPVFVRIENPAPAGRRYTTLKCAAGYVERGWAHWIGDHRIRFCETVGREWALMAHDRRKLETGLAIITPGEEFYHWYHGRSDHFTVVRAERIVGAPR